MKDQLLFQLIISLKHSYASGEKPTCLENTNDNTITNTITNTIPF